MLKTFQDEWGDLFHCKVIPTNEILSDCKALPNINIIDSDGNSVLARIIFDSKRSMGVTLLNEYIKEDVSDEYIDLVMYFSSLVPSGKIQNLSHVHNLHNYALTYFNNKPIIYKKDDVVFYNNGLFQLEFSKTSIATLNRGILLCRKNEVRYYLKLLVTKPRLKNLPINPINLNKGQIQELFNSSILPLFEGNKDV